MNFWASLGKGAVGGLVVGIVSAMILVNYGDPTPSEDVLSFFLFFGILGLLSGILTAISLLIFMGTVQFMNWAIILILGGIGSYITVLQSLVFGWVGFAILSLYIILQRFFSEEFPELFVTARNELIVWIIVYVGLTLFKSWFENLTHLELVIP
ncbi:MAG: hypothetical protein ACKPBB_01440 [Sphaerospermopsis kisseleviana]|uniref:DUF4203 domain-containing protein n=1 Tax=Sphaerospermopsis aphanizomenoides LEGE 00250 TaxID=2777972 RepID=A0ABR9VAX4_9CYAN|nr:hypothetical protein [Sphaerospermopsis aphanizomenoides]MBE9235646.1 hypothetical protein [Sphaerospermopsis aphanizomenoides LEGE 00250]